LVVLVPRPPPRSPTRKLFTFSTDFGSGVQVVKRDDLVDQLLREKYGPQAVLAETGGRGLVYRVYKVRRCTQGWLLLMGAVYPSEQTRHELPPSWSEDSWESYGFGQASAQGYGSYTLGRCTVPREGILFEWVLLEPRGTVPRDLLTLRVTMHPDGKLQERQKQLHGQDAWWFDGPLAVKVPDGPEVPFVQVLDEVHEDLSEMGAAGFFLEPHQAPEWESGPVDRQYWCTPMTRDAFRKHVEQVIEKLSQGRPTSLPE
jgi:hypothetical protein